MELTTLQLTTEQFSCLLIMADELFKDYAEPHNNGNGIDYCTLPKAGHSAGLFLTFYNDSGTIRIHWFEFCIMHLAGKLLNDNKFLESAPTKVYYNWLEVALQENKHPVDYLYEKHLKLKNDNNKQSNNLKKSA